MVGNQKEIEDDNDIVINGLLDVDPYDLDDQPFIIRSAVDDIRSELIDNNKGASDDNSSVTYKCRIKNCHRDITYSTHSLIKLWLQE